MGSVVDAITGGDARDAAGAQVDAGREAAKVQREIFQQTREDLAPARLTGNQALFSLADLFGVPRPTSITPEPIQQDEMNPQAGQQSTGNRLLDRIFGIESQQRTTSAPQPTGDQFAPQEGTFVDGGFRFTEPGSRRENAMQNFFTSPGFEFRRDQGIEAIERSNAARGRLDSGASLKDLNRFGQGLASQEFNNFANRLASLAGVGQGATGQTAQAGQNFANAQSNILTGMGNARASGFIGQGNAIRGLIGSGIQAAPGIMAAMSDRRLKRDVSHVGETPGGFNLYRFRYLWSDDWHEGVMADEVEPHIPDAVFEVDGYKAVDYSKVH